MISRSVFRGPGGLALQTCWLLRASRITRARPSLTRLTEISFFNAAPTPASSRPPQLIFSLFACSVAIYNGQPFLCARHGERLKEHAKTLKIRCGGVR